MTSVRTIIRKELRSYFLSPVALIFLGVFLVATLFIFFTYAKFFIRNLADVRPLFSWLPILLIFLVSAVTMRQWSEEQKMGTLELLLTLPLRTRDMVLGKFIAGMYLVGLALLLTLPLAITAAWLGNLDWGPVIGGYVAALLLAGMYMAIGLCVSARTDNQIVALMVTALICALFYLIGSDSVAGVFGPDVAEVLRGLGSGSRFESIERGVLDLRDLAYYGSLTAFFLLLNMHFLEAKRLDKQPAGANNPRPQMLITAALAALNVVAVNVWLAPVTSARADLTADGEYSVGPVTEDVLARLDEPLLITGYLSEKTHPKLAPIIPRLQDFLQEYAVRGDGKVTVRFLDPATDPDLEEEIQEQFGIKAVAFQVSGHNEEAIISSFFHIVIQYGDEHEVLSYQDLIEIHVDDSDVHIRPRNIEYDVTRAIKKVSQSFQSLEASLAKADQTVKLTAYISGADTLPEEFKEAPKRLATVATKLKARLGGRLEFKEVNPDESVDVQREIMQLYGFQPLARDLLGQERFYFHLLLETGKYKERVFPQGGLAESDLRTSIEAAIKRGTPGFLKTIGLMTKETQTQPNSPFGQQAPKQSDFRGFEQVMRSDYQVRKVKGDDGAVPGDIDVLVVAKPGDLTDNQLFAIDQYVMRGGAVIVLAGAHQIVPERTGIRTEPINHKLAGLLKTWGVTIEDAWVMDPQSLRFPYPVREVRGGRTYERIYVLDYPLFIDVRTDGFNADHAALSGVPSLALTWTSPVTLAENLEGRTGDVLIHSSKDAWIRKAAGVEPDVADDPRTGFKRPEGDEGAGEKRPLAVSLTGVFPSHFADKPSPIFGKAADPNVSDGDRTGRTIKQSTPDARVAVVGSSEFISDLIMQLGGQFDGGSYRGNQVFITNLVDWAVEDTDLISIRSAGAFARTLEPLKPEEKTRIEIVNYAVVLLALLGVLAIATTRRRMAKPMVLDKEAS